jgi:rhodanese-related sulfurtransferase
LERHEEAIRAVEKANALRAKLGWGALTTQTVGDHREGAGRRYYFKWFGDYKPLREGLRKAGVTPEANWSSLVSSGVTGFEVKGAKSIDAKIAKTLHERGVPFIDINNKWLYGRIPGAYHLDRFYYEFNEVRLAQIVGKAQEVVIYSSSSREGRRVPETASRAVLWGYERIHFFPDGLTKWKDAGYPVQSGK